MDIWLFALVFAAVLSGWLLGRWQPFRKKEGELVSDHLSEHYAKGLNYLLADDSDNAIRIFTDLIEVNRDTIEIHIALGSLFRSKGEVDRAIKVHQNLLARPNLTRKQRHTAIAELASARVANTSQLTLRSTRSGRGSTEQTPESLTDDLLGGE